MATILISGVLVLQRADQEVVYSFGDNIDLWAPIVSRVLPPGNGFELVVSVDGPNVRISGGINGANYVLVFPDGRKVDVRVTSYALDPEQLRLKRIADRKLGR